MQHNICLFRHLHGRRQGMASKLKRTGIQRRLDICKAREADPDITYRQLQTKFLVSSRIVAQALKGGRATWERMLAGPSAPGTPLASSAAPTVASASDFPSFPATVGTAHYLAATIEPQQGRGDPPPFRYRAAGEQDWHQIDAIGIDGLLATLASQGWELVYMGRVGFGHGTSAFGGAYECIFKARG
nr:hypothetical protein [Candidatus Sigynarchaeota archaeon]